MPQLNREFNDWINSDENVPEAVVIEKLKEVADRHAPLIAEMEACESELLKLESPFWAVAVYDYLAMAHYQLSAIWSRRAQYSAKAGNADDADYFNTEAIKHAGKSVEYAEKGLEWNRRIVQGQLPAALSSWWTQEQIESDAKKLLDPKDRIDSALLWYRTAGRAILAYYKWVPFNEAHTEVKLLKTEFQYRDPPEDDPTMRWVLTSKSGERPQSEP